jgi:hypothetical protein
VNNYNSDGGETDSWEAAQDNRCDGCGSFVEDSDAATLTINAWFFRFCRHCAMGESYYV